MKEKTKTKTYEISVRALVEFILKSGDIVSGFASSTRALEGTRLHQKLQKAEKAGYEKEVSFKKQVDLAEDAVLLIEGRADGIYTSAEGERVVDEIKSTTLNLEYVTEETFPLHWAQAKCYAHMLAAEEGLTAVTIRLSYIHVETEAVKYLYQKYSAEELKAFWQDLVCAYQKWLKWKHTWDQNRTENLQQLAFPFQKFRRGQRTMAAYIYRCIRESEKIFLQAPTGIGKTISSLFPALKAMGEEKLEKIFYLTAKNVTGKAALQAIQQLRASKLHLKTLHLTAKDRVCLKEKRECDPQKCPYAKGHYDRVNEAVFTALQTYDHFEKEQIQQIAEKYQVCPFELSLDIAVWCDLIICDYNYAFDPSASLKRFFQERKKEYVLLIDEAHNLVDRAREMFSAEISKQAFLSFRSMLNKNTVLYRRASRVNTLFLEMKKDMAEDMNFLPAEPEEKWYYALKKFSESMEEYLQLQVRNQKMDEPIAEEVWELYFSVLFFLKIWDQRGDGYQFYLKRDGRDWKLRFFCTDPSQPLKAVYAQVRSVIFFSATLMPIDYYKELLGGEKEEKAIALESPFAAKHKKVMVSRLKTSYQAREQSLEGICKLLQQMIAAKEGHYMVFFPSFAYMEQVYACFTEREPQARVIKQESQMSEEERQAFLQQFYETGGALLGFCVLGGVFSEGIDLRREALLGVMIVSVGIPQLGLERDLIREHMEQAKGKGFEYAYMYPGIGKVFQAAGRVIRTEEDKGIILLVDERFDQQRYYELYPRDWFPITKVQQGSLPGVLEEFWNGE